MRHNFICILVVAVLTGAGFGSAATIDPTVLERTIEATVYVKVMYEFDYGIGSWTSTGTGFFVDTGGYVVTNHHVISDEVEVPMRDGTTMTVKANKRTIKLVINSGSDNERELAATLVGSDRKSDLALIKVPFKPSQVVSVFPVAEPKLAQQIWAIGFPFGGLLSADTLNYAHAQSNPEVSLSSGMVASLRRDKSRALRLVQTDAALNPGNSGGPLIDENGFLAGVVSFGIDGGNDIGFGIAPKIVQNFLLRYAVKVEVRPRMILDPPEPISVAVYPQFEGLKFASVNARLIGHDIATTEIVLEPSQGGYRGLLAVGEETASSGDKEGYRAEILFVDSDGVIQAQRAIRLSASARPIPARTLMRATNPKPTPKAKAVQTTGGSDLAAIAGSVEITKTNIDNNDVEIDAGKVQDPKLYEGIFGFELRTAASKYDLLTNEIIAQDRLLKKETESRYANKYRIRKHTNALLELRDKQAVHGSAIRDGGLCRCPDATWHHREQAPCSTCYTP